MSVNCSLYTFSPFELSIVHEFSIGYPSVTKVISTASSVHEVGGVGVGAVGVGAVGVGAVGVGGVGALQSPKVY